MDNFQDHFQNPCIKNNGNFCYCNYAKCIYALDSVSSLIPRCAPRSRLRRLFNEITLRAPVDLQHNVIMWCSVGVDPVGFRGRFRSFERLSFGLGKPGFFGSVCRREEGNQSPVALPRSLTSFLKQNQDTWRNVNSRCLRPALDSEITSIRDLQPSLLKNTSFIKAHLPANFLGGESASYTSHKVRERGACKEKINKKISEKSSFCFVFNFIPEIFDQAILCKYFILFCTYK